MKPTDKPWILTDSDTEQYGRKLSDWVYEFKQKTKHNDEWIEDGDVQLTIDLEEYSEGQVEDVICAYGYSLKPWVNTYIFDIYHNKETVNWVIAECIFENESQNYQ